MVQSERVSHVGVWVKMDDVVPCPSAFEPMNHDLLSRSRSLVAYDLVRSLLETAEQAAGATTPGCACANCREAGGFSARVLEEWLRPIQELLNERLSAKGGAAPAQP